MPPLPKPEFWIESPAARSAFNLASAALFAALMAATALALLAPDLLGTMLATLGVSGMMPGFIADSTAANVKALRALGSADIGAGLGGLRQVGLVLAAIYVPAVSTLLWWNRQATAIPASMTRQRAALIVLIAVGLAAYVMLSPDVFLVGDGSAPAVVPLHVALAVFGLNFFGTTWSLPVCLLAFVIPRDGRQPGD